MVSLQDGINQRRTAHVRDSIPSQRPPNVPTISHCPNPVSRYRDNETSRISNQMLNLLHIKLDMRIHLHILIIRRMNLVFDILLQIGHL